MHSVYEAAGGHAGMLRLAEACHVRVMADEMDRRAIACFDLTLHDVGLTAEPLRPVLRDYLDRRGAACRTGVYS